MNTQQLRSVVEAATSAPSVHNTQPWRFVAHHSSGDEIDALDVFADRERALGVIDPYGRELHISCGAAIEMAVLAARSLGFACSVTLMPDGSDEDHLAHIAFEGHQEPDEETRSLVDSIPARHTDRSAFEERPIGADLVEAFRRSVADYGAWLRVLDRPGDVVTTAVLLAKADEVETNDPSYETEMAAWHRSPERAGSAGDGIVPASLAVTPNAARGSSFKLRDFELVDEQADDKGVTKVPAGDEPPAAEHPLGILLGTASDEPVAWLQAGRALARLLLKATAEGVAASPMTQVLEVPATRAMLSHQLGLIGHPQMLLRMGYHSGAGASPRRPIAAVLVE
jgi:nitroreductase